MSNYTSLVGIVENDIRSFVTPPLDYDDVSQLELLLKLQATESWVKYTYFEGGNPPTTSKMAIILIIVSNLLSNPSVAKKYRTLTSETLGDYSYMISPYVGESVQSDPFLISKTWHQMAIDILQGLSSDKRYKLYKVNE
jgi:hypothetical protein